MTCPQDGLVIQLQPIDNDGEFAIDIEKIGRKVATISTNFCGFHDTKLFLPIESRDYRKNNKEQEFLFAYRAFAREYHAKREVKNVQENARKMAKGGYKHFWLFRIPYANVFYEHFRTSHKAEILVNPLNAFALAY